MTHRTAEEAAALWARIAGALWVACIAASAVALGPMTTLVVRNDAAATAHNILAHESLFRLGFVAELAAGVFYVGVTVLLYRLLEPVSRSLSLLAAFFGLGGFVIGGAGYVCRLAPVLLLSGEPYLGAFTTSQLEAMAYTSLKLHGTSFYISMVLFGLQCLTAGVLLVRSRIVPRIVGVLLAIAGASYPISSLASFLSPPLGATLWAFASPAALLGEGSTSLWLLARGIRKPVTGCSFPRRRPEC